jgi:membrane-associated phospholipid phosphatase
MSPRRHRSAVERTDLRLAPKVALDQRSRVGRATARFAELGDQPPLLALSAGVVGAGLARRDERLARVGLRMILAHSLATMGKLFVKDLVDRTRPGALGEKAYRMEKGSSRDGRLRSMPSGHSAGAAAVAGAVAPDFPVAAVPVALTATAIAAAQPASRNHYLSDVVAGAAIGLAAGMLARLLVPPCDGNEQPA